MGRDKALLPWPKPVQGGSVVSSGTGGTLLSAAIRALSSSCDLVVVVAGKNADALAPTIYAESAFLVCNAAPERGQFSSLHVAMQEVLDRGRDTAMITLVDRPPARSDTLDALAREFLRRDHATWAVVPEFEGKHGHPILVGREMIEMFLRAPVNSSAREVEHANQAHVSYFPVRDSLVTANINTMEDYLCLQSTQ